MYHYIIILSIVGHACVRRLELFVNNSARHFKNIYLFLCYVWIFYLHICLCILGVCACRGPKRTRDPLELEFHVVVSTFRNVNADNQTWVL